MLYPFYSLTKNDFIHFHLIISIYKNIFSKQFVIYMFLYSVFKSKTIYILSSKKHYEYCLCKI